MVDFTDYKAWGFLLLLGVLLLAFLIAYIIKHVVPFMRKALIPTSVLAGIILLLVSFIYTMIVGPDDLGEYTNLFNGKQFGGDGLSALYYITFHCLALGFIASFFRNNKKENSKGRFTEVVNTGVTTVSCYLLQAILGLGITMVIGLFVSGFFSASGILLPFGFGQGTGQALNYGTIYQGGGDGAYSPFVGGANFGLTIAALGFIASSIGGVIFLQHYKKKHPELKFNESVDEDDEDANNLLTKEAGGGKLSIQLGLILVAYAVGFAMMYLLGLLIPSMKSTIFGLNFIFGILGGLVIKLLVNFLRKKNVLKKDIVSSELMSKISNFFFDIMIVAGFACIQLELLIDYWWVLLILAVVGTISTYIYNLVVAKTLFKDYPAEQFVMMYGMLTGTASTGMILLRELDPKYETPVADNLVFQNLPAIILGLPMLVLATIAPTNTVLTLVLCIAYFIVLNVFLFRKFIFRRKKKEEKEEQSKTN